MPNSGRGGRWLGPSVGSSQRVLSGFTRQQQKPFLSVGKRQDLLTLADLLAAGQVTPVIDRTHPLDEAADDLRYVGAGHTRGKDRGPGVCRRRWSRRRAWRSPCRWPGWPSCLGETLHDIGTAAGGLPLSAVRNPVRS
ncbi:zinc-binding dehydrogenase [Dactylosporangium sp. NPDC050588]|uniref:zinc-binding dehydrogenase n=1 Tax=Dactylosporangium sp. NPDC050588 TaxID=3157211 RepID=UPI0033F597D9